MMPRINGWQILHQLKSNPATANIPVILLTVLEDRSAGYVLGADEYLVKPVARDSLLNVLHHLMNRQTQITVTEEKITGQAELVMLPTEWTNKTAQTTSLEPIVNNDMQGINTEHLKPILLIHNEADIYALLERLIKDREYTIETTPEGQDVLQIIEKAHPDLLMMLIRIKEKYDA